MNEFNNRIEAQRQILQLVNRYGWAVEELFGLSAKGIGRWISVNRIDPKAALVELVQTASSKLFFLANKSQEQVSSEYRDASTEISLLTAAIESEVESLRHQAKGGVVG
jgi:hypothetical protein